jgi:hypothetical protein
LGILLLLFVVALVVEAIFIWIASAMVGMPRSGFGVAFKAAFFAWILGIVFGVLAGFLSVALTPFGAQALGLLFTVLGGTLAIQTSYGSGFWAALITFIVAWILTVVVLVGMVFVLIAVLGVGAAGAL